MSSLITVAQLAGRLQVSESTIYDAVANGRLSCYRISCRGRGTSRYDEEQVRAYLEHCRQEGADDEKLTHIR